MGASVELRVPSFQMPVASSQNPPPRTRLLRLAATAEGVADEVTRRGSRAASRPLRSKNVGSRLGAFASGSTDESWVRL